MTPHEFWNALVPGMWLLPCWLILMTLTSVGVGVFGFQAARAATGHRWPAMYIHLAKTTLFIILAVMYLLNVIWRKVPPDDVTMSGLLLYITRALGTMVFIWEGIWRMGQDAQREALARVTETHVYLKENA